MSFFCAFPLVRSGPLKLLSIILRILEGVQRQATSFILNCSYKVSERPNYKSWLKSLKLLPLCYWQEFRDISFFYKCMHKCYNINVNEYTNIITGRTRNAINSNLRPNRVVLPYFVTRCSIALFLY